MSHQKQNERIILARQCLKFTGHYCDNYYCKNKQCPLNKFWEGKRIAEVKI
jgi:hypothetical protein